MKLKKLLAIGMTVALAFTTLVGCGNDEKADDNDKKGTFKSSLESGMALESYTYESSLSFTAEGESFVGSIDDETKQLLSIEDDSISAKININGKKAKSNATSTLGVTLNNKISADLLDLVLVDNTMYIGVEKLANGISKIFNDISGEDISDQINSMKPEGNYIKVTEEMLSSILEMYDSDNFGMTDMITNNVSTENTEQMTEILTYLSGLLDKAISKSETDAYSSDGDMYKLTISNKNINKIVKALAEIIESESEEVSKKLSKILGYEINASQVTSIASMIKTYDVAALLGAEFSIEITTELKDDTWKFGFSVGFVQDDELLKVSFDYKAVEDKDLTISDPTDLVSDEDLQEFISLFTALDDEQDDDLLD